MPCINRMDDGEISKKVGLVSVIQSRGVMRLAMVRAGCRIKTVQPRQALAIDPLHSISKQRREFSVDGSPSATITKPSHHHGRYSSCPHASSTTPCPHHQDCHTQRQAHPTPSDIPTLVTPGLRLRTQRQLVHTYWSLCSPGPYSICRRWLLLSQQWRYHRVEEGQLGRVEGCLHAEEGGLSKGIQRDCEASRRER